MFDPIITTEENSILVFTRHWEYQEECGWQHRVLYSEPKVSTRKTFLLDEEDEAIDYYFSLAEACSNKNEENKRACLETKAAEQSFAKLRSSFKV